MSLPRLLLAAALLAAPFTAWPQANGYQGLGAASVPPELVARYAPPPLEAGLERRIQSMLDVRAPGLGIPAPDGSRLYFTWRITGSQQVFRVDAPLGFPQQMTGGEDRSGVEAVTGDGRWLVISRDQGGEENPGLYLQAATGGRLRTVQKIEGVRTGLDFASEDGRTLYFHANDRAADSYAIYRYDIARGERSLVFDAPGLWNVADHQGRGDALRLLLVKATGSIAREVAELRLADGTLTPLLGQGEQTQYDVAYGARPGELLVRTNRFGDFSALYRWRIGAGHGPADFVPMLAPAGHDVESFSIDLVRRHIYAGINDGGFTRLEVLDAASGRPLALPLPAGAQQAYAGASTADGRYVAIGIESGRAPRTSYLWDWRRRRLQQWVLPSAPEVELGRFVPAQAMSYPARDGTPIPMFVRFPPGCAPGENPQADPCPVVVQFHGGPEGQARPGFSTYAQLFVDAGFVFVEPNVRGSDGYGKTWIDADNGPRRLDVIGDIDDAGRWVRAHWGRNGKPPRVGVTGGSYGGYATLVAMTMFAGTYDAGASIVGMSNLLTFLHNTAPYRRALRITEYGDPERDAEALRKLSPVTYLDRVQAPLLIIQGLNDPRVPAGEAIQIHDLLEQRGIAAPLILFPDEGHGAAKRSNAVLQVGHVLRFFDQHLKAKPAP